MAGVTIKGLKKSYGDVAVVHGVDLEIADGEFAVIVGPSGCRKSTLLRMVAGLEDISDGTVEIGGEVVNEVAPSKRGVAMVFQTYALYPHMTVYKNMAFGLKQARTPPDEIDRRVRKAAEILQITEFLDRNPRRLSGGQRQRVASAGRSSGIRKFSYSTSRCQTPTLLSGCRRGSESPAFMSGSDPR